MQIMNIKLNNMLVIIVLLGLQSCAGVLGPTTTRAAVVIFNETPSNIHYRAFMSSVWGDRYTIDVNSAGFLYEYEQSSEKEPFPGGIDTITLSLPSCQITLARLELIKYFVRNRDGRAGWDLYVDAELVNAVGCDK